MVINAQFECSQKCGFSMIAATDDQCDSFRDSHINKDINRGVTILDGMGWYSKQPKKVLVILAKRNESLSIFRLVKEIDPHAFISQSNVVGVYGEGFDKIKG